MKKLIALLLCATLALVSCSTKYVVLGTAGLVIGAGVVKVVTDDQKRPEVSPVIENIDITGTIDQLGGVLVNSEQALHVTHWPIKANQNIRIKGKNGEWTSRKVIDKKDLGHDLSLLTFDKPVDLMNHSIIPIGEARYETPTTVFRLRSEPFGTFISGSGEQGDRVKLRPEKGSIISGDSGKMWIQDHDGVHHVVGLTSTQKGWGPNLFLLYNDYLTTVSNK